MEKLNVQCSDCRIRLKYAPKPGRTSIKCPRCGERIAVSVTPVTPETSASRPQRRRSSVAQLQSKRSRSARKPRTSNASGAARYGLNRDAKSNVLWVVGAVATAALCIAAMFWHFNNGESENTGLQIADSESASPKVANSRLGGLQNPSANSPTAGSGEKSSGPIRSPRQPMLPSVAVSSGVNVVVRETDALSYRMKTGDRHAYQISVTTGDRVRQTTSYLCNYTVMNGTLDKWASGESSGTGFVIAADGYIATCAHVVANAATLEISLNGQTYAGKLVALNEQKDLAIVKIDASGLPVCALADSDQIQLAETVRAFGYPLSTVLGAELKVATGSIAGIVNDPGAGRQIQTDAPINPGNSGGPVVDTSGRVVGIATSKLSTRIASSVGLLAPANDLKLLMKEAGLPVAEPAVAKKIEGPEIAKAIRPSMALIRLTGIDGPIYDINISMKNTSSNPFRIPTQFRDSDRPSEMMVSRFGAIVDSKGYKMALPYGIGHVNEFCLLPLDFLGRRQWSSERQMKLQIGSTQSTDIFSEILRQHRLPTPFGRPQQKTTQSLPAEEIVKYTLIDSPETDEKTIRREWSLRTQDSEIAPALNASLSGDIKFDTIKGVPVSGKFDGKVIQISSGRTTTTPVKVSFQHYTTSQLEDLQQEQLAQAARKKANSKRPQPTPSKVADTNGPKPQSQRSTKNGSSETTTAKKSPTQKATTDPSSAGPLIASKGSPKTSIQPPPEGTQRTFSSSTTTTTEVITNSDGTTRRETTVTKSTTNPFGQLTGNAGENKLIGELKSAKEADTVPVLKQISELQLSTSERAKLYAVVEPLLSSQFAVVRSAAIKALEQHATPQLADRLERLTSSSADGKAAIAKVQQTIEDDRKTCDQVTKQLARKLSQESAETNQVLKDLGSDRSDELLKSKARSRFFEEALLKHFDRFSTPKSQQVLIKLLLICGTEKSLPVLQELSKSNSEAIAAAFAIEIRMRVER